MRGIFDILFSSYSAEDLVPLLKVLLSEKHYLSTTVLKINTDGLASNAKTLGKGYRRNSAK